MAIVWLTAIVMKFSITGYISRSLGILLLSIFNFFIGGGTKGEVCRSKTNLNGKTVIITGGNTGIGKETAIELAKRNARVILACRNQEKGKNAAMYVRNESENKNVHFRQLDLSSFASIRKFTQKVLEEESLVDILINNAGIMHCSNHKTEDGFETQFGVNHLGHFLLTNLLLDKIKQAPEGRIVNVSSSAHKFSPQLNFSTINEPGNFYTSHYTYPRSKLANILFTKALAKRLQGTNVTVNALHPGIVATDMNHQSLLIMVRNYVAMP